MKGILLIIIGLFTTHVSFGQRIPETGITVVHINTADKNIVAEVMPLKSDPTPDPSNFYYWYGAGTIHQTQGGYSGKLLNGKYSEYYPSKNLKEQGSFKKGLKNDVWESWDENGNLKELYTYRNGEKTGLFNLYDEKGARTQTGTYNKNLLNGKVTFYTKDSTKIVRYKDGKIVPSSAHKFPGSIKFINKIFHKKEKADKFPVKPKDK
jgi:hypothetical protein